MKTASILLIVVWIVMGCQHEQSPYTAAEETNNPPKANPAFTNPVPTNSTSQPASTRTTNAAPRPQ